MHNLTNMITIVILLLAFTFLCVANQNGTGFVFDFKSHYTPHPEKAHRGGQDAFFANKDLIVIADGVGGWSDIGIDPSKFSRQLAKKAGESFFRTPSTYRASPREIIRNAHQGNDNIGSATMMALVLQQNMLKGCYVGDSGFMVIREYQTYQGYQLLNIYEFTEQQHGFNYPYQLAPSNLKTDLARDAICLSIQVQKGDIIVAGSDGLFDNISFLKLKERVKTAIKDGTLLTGLPQILATEAISYGQDTTYNSPFAQRAKQLGIMFNGGKLDDTTVVIARVAESNNFKPKHYFQTNPQLLDAIKIEPQESESL